MRLTRLVACLLWLVVASQPLAAQRHSSGRSGGSTHVRGYTRHDGTYVHPYTRSAPRSYATPRSYAAPRAHAAPRAYTTPRSYTAPRNGPRDSRGRMHRSREAKDEFLRRTGYPRGRPGYVVDHIIPLCAGGADAPSNMQWQTVEAAKVKDGQERAQCSRAKH
jgi:hypothetical protein